MKFTPRNILGPLYAIGLATTLAACNDMDIQIDGDGVPLSEFDTSGDAPTGVTLAGPDNLVVTTGDSFTIEVEGDEEVTDKLRFDRDGDNFAVYREGKNWSGDNTATIRVTVPSLDTMNIAGSGTIEADRLSGDATVSIGGSGKASAASVEAGRLDVNIGGSGSFTGSGTADSLDFNLGGSGEASMAEITVGSADINIAGSGKAIFASGGNVEANIFGSGTVTVTGGATCKANTVGSGKLICDDVETEPNT